MQKQRPNTLSTQLTELFTEINNTFRRGKELVVKAYKLALQEGYTPQEAKNLLLANIKVFGKSTIYSSLPEESKDQIKANAGRVSHSKSLSVPKLEQVEGKLNEDTTEEHEFNTEGMGVAILDDDKEEHVDVAGIAANVLILPNNDKKPIDIPPQAREILHKLELENVALNNENKKLKSELAKYQNLPNNDALYNQIAELKKELEQRTKEHTIENEDLRNEIIELRKELGDKETNSTTNTPTKDWLLGK